MDSLTQLRTLFTSLGKEVTDFTGFSMKADGYTWGLLHDDPVRDGVVIAPIDWKAYIKALKAGAPAPELVAPKEEARLADIAKSLGIGSNLPSEQARAPRRQDEHVTCPHCNKSGGAAGMRIHHFDHCKQKAK